jgi:hypothetical protein
MQGNPQTPQAPERITLNELETLRIQVSAATVEKMLAQYQGAKATVAHLELALPKAQDDHNKLAEGIIEMAKARASVGRGRLPAPVDNLEQVGAPIKRGRPRKSRQGSLTLASNGNGIPPGEGATPPELPPAA